MYFCQILNDLNWLQKLTTRYNRAMAKKGKAAASAAKVAKKSRVPTVPLTRLRKLTRRQAKRKAKAEARGRAKPPNSFKLTWQTIVTIRRFWKAFVGIVLVYLILNVVFASGLSNLGSAVRDIKFNLSDQSISTAHPVIKALGGFGTLVVSAGSSGSGVAAVLQSVLFIIESLVIIWALRQLLAGKAIRVKQAYYHSMYPLIPFILVLVVIVIQLLPITLGATVFTFVFTGALTNLAIANWLTAFAFLLLALWSFYMLTASVFALYVVTLPEMEPRSALRSARNLVRYRRRVIFPKILFLPAAIFAMMGLIIIPLIIYASFLVAPAFYILSMLAVLFAHTYLYSLYRSLIA